MATERPTIRAARPAPGRIRGCARWAIALTFIVSSPAPAAVYKCDGNGGTPIYQGEPCPPGTELRNFDRDPPNVSVIPGISTVTSVAPTTPRRTTGDVAPGHPRESVSAEPRSAAQRKFIRSGMSEAEVVSRVGGPDVTTGARGTNSARTQRWSYLPTDADPDTITTVTIVNGVVNDVERKVMRR